MTAWKHISTLLLVGLWMTVVPVANAQEDPLFSQGKEQYKQENYLDAIANWTKVLDKGSHSAALYFNLGNAHYKLNQIGPSIYYYEKALQLAPNDADIKNNLSFAKNATVDAIEPLPQTLFAKWDEQLSSLLTYEGWAWSTGIASVLLSLLFLLYYFSGGSGIKRLYFAGFLLATFVLITSVAMSYRVYDRTLNDRNAIVFAQSSEIKNEPSLGSETAFVLHEGTQVQILETEDDWCHIRIADGKDGWIPLGDIKEL